jgi:hypothetical protein
MAKEKPSSVNEAFVVTRSIPVDAPAGRLDSVAGTLASLPGVDYSHADSGNSLKVRYDAAKLGFWEIERKLNEAGVGSPSGLWWRIKSEWYRFTDSNARSNAHATAACCSRPPVVPSGKPEK